MRWNRGKKEKGEKIRDKVRKEDLVRDIKSKNRKKKKSLVNDGWKDFFRRGGVN